MTDNDPMPLGKRQELFMRLLPRLIDWFHANGYELRGGELWRSPAAARENAASGAGIANSLHIDKLAIDLNLFRNGTWLNKTEDFAAAGVYWKSLHPLCRWGGDWKSRKDGNHFSVTYAGRE